MQDNSLSSVTRLLSTSLKQYGYKTTAGLIYGLLLLLSVLTAALYFYVISGHVAFVDVFGVVFFAAIALPIIISITLDNVQQLQVSIKHADSATKQEKLLNQTLTDNIRRLNVEIEERKMAFNAKHHAIEELRKEVIERKKTQAELAEQSMLLRSIVDSSPDLFYYRDVNGRFAGCNRMFEEVMGLSKTQLLGKKVEEIYPESYVPEVLRTDAEVQKQKASLTLDVEYPVGDTKRWFEMRKVPFIDEQGRYIGLLAFGRDITSRKEAEQALETAYKDKGKFIATLSHELRTPLNGIVGLTRMLLDTQLTDAQRSWCKTVFSSAETLGNIFNDIIDLDKIDREQLDIAYEVKNLDEFINDVVNFAGLIADQKGLQFNTELRGDFQIDALVDPTRLRQVLWNLINNAVKFTQQGHVTLRCARQTTAGKEWLSIAIEDTGPGIAPEQQGKIFDMYYKVPDVKGGNALGSGIGLAVSKALINTMGGDIWVESELDKGSCFTIKIPLEQAEAVTAAPTQLGKSLYILLVEDVPLNAEIATNLLEQRGHEVLWAETGEDALSYIQTEDELDLVLLDMQLPDINGDEIARQVRADSYFDNLPIVALTANVRNAEKELEGITIQGALGKPINTKKLDAMLLSLFGEVNNQVSESKETLVELEDESGLLDTETITDFVNSMGLTAFARSSGLFNQLAPGYQDELCEASDSSDLAEFKSVAHKLKGAAGSIGLQQVQLLAKEMENGSESSDKAQQEAWLKHLKSLIAKSEIALSEYLKRLG